MSSLCKNELRSTVLHWLAFFAVSAFFYYYWSTCGYCEVDESRHEEPLFFGFVFFAFWCALVFIRLKKINTQSYRAGVYLSACCALLSGAISQLSTMAFYHGSELFDFSLHIILMYVLKSILLDFTWIFGIVAGLLLISLFNLKLKIDNQ